MMAKILTQNELVLYRSTYRAFTPEESADEEGQEQKHFMKRLYNRLLFQVLPRDLEDVELKNSHQYDHHEDDTQ